MEEQKNSKQPQIPTPNKTPKRVVRTYQADLARLSKNMEVPLETGGKKGKKKKEQKPQAQKKTSPQKPKGLVTPPKEKVTLEEKPMEAEVKKRYVEEIQTTDSVDLSKVESFTQKDLEKITSAPPADKPKAPKTPPVQTPLPKPLPKKEPMVFTEEASAPKQTLFGGIMEWLMGGIGEAPKVPKPVQKPIAPVATPKKLESVPVVPNVKPREEEKIEAQKPEPKPKLAPEKPKMPELEPQIHNEVILPQKEEPQKAKNPLFAPPKEIREDAVPAVSLPPTPQKKPEDFKAPSPISTYTSDARKGIKKQKETPLSALAKQQDSKKAEPKRQQTKKSSTPIIVTAVALLVLGIGAVAGAFYFLNQDTAPVATPTRVVTPVFAEDRTRVSASAIPDLEDLEDLLASVPAPFANTLTHVTFSAQTETGSEIVPFSDILLRTNAVPGTLARSVYPQSMLGVFGEDKEPVLVLAVTSFERSFKSLLSWEDAMPDALSPLFGELDTTVVGTTTPPFVQNFVDEEIETTDARILYDAGGNTHLIYGFVTPNILFITKTKDTFIDLTDRIVRE